MVKLLSGSFILRLMKVLAFQLLIVSVSFAIPSNGQSSGSLENLKVKLERNSYTIEQLFDVIEDKSDLSFAYHKADLKGHLKRVISVTSSQDVSVQDLLMKISEKSGLEFKRINNTINVINNDNRSSKGTILKEPYPVKGLVIDDQGEGLPGATVFVKGTEIGTITDVEGRFIINAPEGNQVIVVSFVGFTTQEMPISA